MAQVPKKIPTNITLAGRAIEAIKSPKYPNKCGYCQMFVRLVVQSLYGSQFDKWLWKESAHLAAEAFKESPYYVHPSHGSVIGDILYWSATANNPFGHVAIRIPGNMIAENSTRHAFTQYACKGTASLHGIRPYQVIVRLPEGKIRMR